MQRRTFLAVVAASLAATGIFLGAATARLVSIRSSAVPPADIRQGAAKETPRSPAVPPESWGNIFAPGAGMALPSKVAGTAAKISDAPRTSYTLVGTIVSDDPNRRRAILWAEGMKIPRMVREHDEIEPGVRLSSVERSHVWLARGKEREKLDLLPVGSRTRAVSAPAAPAPASAQQQPSGTEAAPNVRITKIRDNVYGLDEAGVSQLTGNFNQYLTQVRLIPFFEGSRPAGYRVASVRPGSTFEQLGFQGGDVIQQINNLEVSSPEKMFTIFQNLKDEKKVVVNILRGGNKSAITYEIR